LGLSDVEMQLHFTGEKKFRVENYSSTAYSSRGAVHCRETRQMPSMIITPHLPEPSPPPSPKKQGRPKGLGQLGGRLGCRAKGGAEMT